MRVAVAAPDQTDRGQRGVESPLRDFADHAGRGRLAEIAWPRGGGPTAPACAGGAHRWGLRVYLHARRIRVGGHWTSAACRFGAAADQTIRSETLEGLLHAGETHAEQPGQLAGIALAQQTQGEQDMGPALRSEGAGG